MITETTEVLGYEWRWLARDANIIEAQESKVVIACGYRHLVLYRIERWSSGDTGGVREVSVKPEEVEVGY